MKCESKAAVRYTQANKNWKTHFVIRITPELFVESGICYCDEIWCVLKKVQDWESMLLLWTSFSSCMRLGKTFNISEPQSHHLQNGIKDTCPVTSQGSSGWDKVWERALGGKALYCDHIIFWLYSSVFLPTSKVTFRMKRERKETLLKAYGIQNHRQNSFLPKQRSQRKKQVALRKDTELVFTTVDPPAVLG